MSTWTKIGAIWKKKADPSKKYLKVTANVTLTEGQFVEVQDPRQRKGITAEQLARIPDGLVAELVIAPPRE